MRFCRIWGRVHFNSPFVETAFSKCKRVKVLLEVVKILYRAALQDFTCK